MTRTEELEKKLEENKAKRAEAEEAQYEKDLEARIAVEDEHGAIAAVKCSRFITGQPTRAYLRMPTSAEYKRYKDQIHRAYTSKSIPAQTAASELLARACWVYPAGEAQAEMLEAFPGLLTTLSIAAAALAEGKNEDEGKG